MTKYVMDVDFQEGDFMAWTIDQPQTEKELIEHFQSLFEYEYDTELNPNYKSFPLSHWEEFFQVTFKERN